MTRMVAIGTVIGFTLTIIALSLWERRSSPEPHVADAGAPALLVNPKHIERFRIGANRRELVGGPALDGKRVFSATPVSTVADEDDAGAP